MSCTGTMKNLSKPDLSKSFDWTYFSLNARESWVTMFFGGGMISNSRFQIPNY